MVIAGSDLAPLNGATGRVGDEGGDVLTCGGAVTQLAIAVETPAVGRVGGGKIGRAHV